jgi:hypothetical protein
VSVGRLCKIDFDTPGPGLLHNPGFVRTWSGAWICSRLVNQDVKAPWRARSAFRDKRNARKHYRFSFVFSKSSKWPNNFCPVEKLDQNIPWRTPDTFRSWDVSPFGQYDDWHAAMQIVRLIIVITGISQSPRDPSVPV